MGTVESSICRRKRDGARRGQSARAFRFKSVDGSEFAVQDEEAKVLRALIDAGERGAEAMRLAPRRPQQVMRVISNLRRTHNLDIAFDLGRPGDGPHGRYRLNMPVCFAGAERG